MIHTARAVLALALLAAAWAAWWLLAIVPPQEADRLADALRGLPGLASVEVFGPADAARRIVHLRDWHGVTREMLVASLRSGLGREPTEAEIDDAVSEAERRSRAVQAELVVVLRAMTRDHGLKAVHVEGVSPESLELYQYQLRELATLDIADEPEALAKFSAVEQLAATGEKLEVLPAEDERAYAAANPIGLDGKPVEVDDAAKGAREEAIAKELLKSGPMAVVLLGGAHDLADELQRLAPEVGYLRVTVRAYPGER